MSVELKVNVLAEDGTLLCSATASANDGTATYSSQNAQVRSIQDAMGVTQTGTLEIVIAGKSYSMPVSVLQSSGESHWTSRALATLVPFNSSRTYANVDADTVTAINGLGRGLNLGQVWESVAKSPANPLPGAYRDLRITSEVLRRIKLAGFNHVRFPCNWARQAGSTSPYTVNATQLAAYKADVDKAIAQGLKVIINQHHSHLCAAWAGWASEAGGSLTRADMLVRQSAIMVQVATAFVGYSANDVILELENEPHVDAGVNGSNPGWTDAEWESYWPGALSAVRAANPNIVVLLGGTNYNNTSKLSVLGTITDSKTALMAHPYEPHTTFTHMFGGAPLWTLASRALLQASIDTAYAQSVARGRPCVMSEFGCGFFTPLKHRAMYLRDAANAFFSYGMPFSAWNAYGGGFDIFCLAKGKFYPGLSEALTGVVEPTFHEAIPVSGNVLDWSMAYWGIGTGTADASPVATVSVSGDTLTFNASGTHMAYYVPTKGVDLTPGRRFRFVLSGSGGGGTAKFFFQKIGPQIGTWDGIVQTPMPSPSNGSSTPAWGDHAYGTYEYLVPDVYPTDPVHTANDPWCFRIQFTSMVPGATRTLVVTALD